MKKQILFVVIFCYVQSFYGMFFEKIYNTQRYYSLSEKNISHTKKYKKSTFKRKSRRIKLNNLQCKKSNAVNIGLGLNLTTFISWVGLSHEKNINECIELTSYDPRYFLATTFIVSLLLYSKTIFNILTYNTQIKDLKNKDVNKKYKKEDNT